MTKDMKNSKLTIKQKKLLEFYQNKDNWRPPRPPTYSQMAKFMGIKIQSVFDMFCLIKKKMGDMVLIGKGSRRNPSDIGPNPIIPHDSTSYEN